MKLSQIMSHSQSSESLVIRKHTPWIASPLDSRAEKLISHHGEPEHSKSNAEGRVVEFDGRRQHRHDSDIPIFKEHHESSVVELFYDLFFVANLATFTTNHDIVDKTSLTNYIGFFTILWFTWLETSLFDVRFSSDSVFNRVCKSISFGVMTGFAVCGAIYDTTHLAENAKAFRALSIILMVSRLSLVAQYAVVLWYVKGYKKTFRPLAATMASLFIAAMVFLGMFFAFPVSGEGDSFPIQHGSSNTYIGWYVVVCVEALAVITISCRWRVVSFKHTHLVERIGLLTLIIMGEGILGMTKSVSLIIKNSTSVSGSDIATIVSAVLLIYFIWVLYFDQIEHDRFGTIRQQIWAILHYPLHVAILLTVEGSASLILWNIFVHFDIYWWTLYYDVLEPTYVSNSELIASIKQAIEDLGKKFKADNLAELYDYNQNLTSIATLDFNSTDWSNRTTDIVNDIWYGIQNAIFSNFGINGAEAPAGHTETQVDLANGYFNTVATALAYFYISAGSFLIILAVMYWFGKTHKSRGEYVSIVVRVVAGIGIVLTLIANYTSWQSSEYFVISPWLIPVVMLGYFVVIVLDNLLVWHTNKTIARQTSNNRNESFSITNNLDRRGHSVATESDGSQAA